MTEKSAGRDQTNIWTVVNVAPENQDIHSLYLEGSDEKFARRKAGQYASIRIMRPDGWSEPHPFTISGAPEDALLRFTIKKEGLFTSAIPDLKPGTPVKCAGPLGAFCKNIDMKPFIVLMAGGVGVTPFLSVLRHFRNIKASNKVMFFWVNKTITEIICLDEIKEMTRVLDLTVVHCLSREEDAERYFQHQYPHIRFEKGRLSADIFTRHGVTKNAAFYLCGPPPMMEAALKELGNLDVDQSAVEQERFVWK